MALVAKPLLTNGAVVSTWWLVLLVTMFSDVMLLEVVSSVKAPVAHSTRKAARLMNGLLMPLQCVLASEALGANIADRLLAMSLGRRWQRRQQVNTRIPWTSHLVRFQVSL